jgi:hypothetical protein
VWCVVVGWGDVSFVSYYAVILAQHC